jgi:MFS family permease
MTEATQTDGAKDWQEKLSAVFPPIGQANLALAILLLAYIFSFIDRQILSILVEPIKADIGITDFQMSLLQGLAFSLFYVAMSIPISRMADAHNRKNIIIPAIALWSVMTALCGLARSFGMLFFARVGVAVGESAITPATFSMLSDYYPPRLLARATSIFTLGVTLGSGLAYIVGGAVVELVTSTGPVSLPFIGELQGWQMAFIVVGVPGLAVAALATLIKEPPRLDLASQDSAAQPVPLSAVVQHLRRHSRCFFGIFGSVAFLSIFGFAYLSWYPTFLIRSFGTSIGVVGMSFGLLYIVFGTAGALSGALMSEFLDRRARLDANPRTVFFAACALIPLAFSPLASSQWVALALAAPTIFFLNAFYGVSVAALQLVTPNRMRAVVTAIFIFFNTVVGVTLGASLVASLTDFVFEDPLALRYSLVIVTAFAAPIAAVFAWISLKPYAEVMKSGFSPTSEHTL